MREIIQNKIEDPELINKMITLGFEKASKRIICAVVYFGLYLYELNLLFDSLLIIDF
jgi:hypothetical protein